MDILFANDTKGTYPNSYYHHSCELLVLNPPLEQSIDCDVCIIGAGFTGLSSALHLIQQGFSVALVDAHRIGWGASGRNGGQVSAGMRQDQCALESKYGKKNAHFLWQVGKDARDLVHNLIEQLGIDCHQQQGIIYANHRRRFNSSSQDYCKHLKQEYQFDEMEFFGEGEVKNWVQSSCYFGGIVNWNAFHIHPLRFALGLAREAMKQGVEIFENTLVQSIHYSKGSGKRHTIKTEKGSIQSRYLVIACNGYVGNLEKKVSRHTMPINNFLITTEPLGALADTLIAKRMAVADSRFVVNYFRFSKDNRLIFGGGENYSYRFSKHFAQNVQQRMLEVFPQLKGVGIDYSWGGTLAVTTNRLPYFYQKGDNLFSISGFSGHGVALSTLAGKIMAQAIAHPSDYFGKFKRFSGKPFLGGDLLKHSILVLAMSYYAMRDRF